MSSAGSTFSGTVADLMLRAPKTLSGDAPVSAVRAQLDNPNVQVVLLADGTTFRGAITELPANADPAAAAAAFTDPSPETIAPDEPAETAFARAAASPHRRLIVLDENGGLLGLLCLNRSRTRFCGS